MATIHSEPKVKNVIGVSIFWSTKYLKFGAAKA
jgi:hypothetical protein